MADKLIEELIIKVKQQGAKPTEKSLRQVTEAVEAASGHIKVLNGQLKMTPKLLGRIEQASTKAANKLRNIQFGGGTSSSQQLDAITTGLEYLTAEVVESNEILTKLNNNTVTSYQNLANELGASLERVEDGLIDVNSTAQKTTRAFEKVNKGGKRVARGLANTGRQGRNQARSFGDIVKSAGPLPLLYANIAANVFAVSEAYRQLVTGEQLSRLESATAIIGARTGAAITNTATKMQELTGYTLNYGEALKQATAATSYGFTEDNIEKLTMAARRASIAFGVDMQDAINRVIRGTSKLEIELLDELGITTKLTIAYENYAQKLGIAASSLNEYQKRQALVNEINQQSIDKLGALDDIASRGSPWEKLGANAGTAWQELIKNIAEGTSSLAETLNKSLESSTFESRLEKQVISVTDAIRQAGKEQNRGGLANSFVNARDKAEELKKEIESLSFQIKNSVSPTNTLSEGMVEYKNKINELKEKKVALSKALEDVRDGLYEAQQDYGLITEKVDLMASAYSNLQVTLKSTKSSYDSTLASLKDQSVTYNLLYNDVKSLQQAYLDVRAADPSITAEQRLSILKKLGFESEKEMNHAVMMAKAYKNSSESLEKFSVTKAKFNYDNLNSGKSENQLLVQELEHYQTLLASQKALGVGDSRRIETLNKIYSIKTKIANNQIDEVERSYDRAASELSIRANLEPQLLQKKQLLQLEQDRLTALKAVGQSELQQKQTTEDIKKLKSEIASAELAESNSLFGSALGDLASYAPGIDQMNSSLTNLAMSFNKVGESSLTATQMTSMGLQAFQGMLQYTSNQSLQAIDSQIEAERKRDGKSKESVAKIKALEAKKIKEQKKAAKQQILISTAVAMMNAAANPWPLPAIPLMAAAALAGGLALSQASSASSNQLAGSASKDPTVSLTMGKRDNKVDISQQASAGELSYLRGGQGMGNVNNFTPRAAGGVSNAGSAMLVGENGPEVITPNTGVKTYNDNDSSSSSTTRTREPVMFNIQALDAQSIIDRAPEIYAAVEAEANVKGFTLNSN